MDMPDGPMLTGIAAIITIVARLVAIMRGLACSQAGLTRTAQSHPARRRRRPNGSPMNARRRGG